VSNSKFCFFNKERPCDLTCKAAFEVDDPVDNVDCYFIWLAHHFGESLFSLRGMMEGMGGIPFGAAGGASHPGPPGGPEGPPTSPGSGPKGFPNN